MPKPITTHGKPATKPHKAILAAVLAAVTGIAASWPSGGQVTTKEIVLALVGGLIAGGATWAKANPPA